VKVGLWNLGEEKDGLDEVKDNVHEVKDGLDGWDGCS